MEIVYHLGVHQTDEDRILRTLLKNNPQLLKQGIVVPQPGKFRPLLAKIFSGLNGRKADSHLQETFLDAMTDLDDPRRVVMSYDNFICNPHRIFSEGRLYPTAGEKMVILRNIFPDNPVSFCMAIRNLATLAPAIYTLMKEADFQKFLMAVDIRELRWSETIGRMRDAVPDCPITVWCHEDAPVLWPAILAAVGGYRDGTELVGTDDFVATLMTSDGLSRMQGFLAEHPPATEARRRQVVSAFLEKFGLREELEIEYDLPGWTQELIDELTQTYDDDMARIAAIPGVTVLG